MSDRYAQVVNSLPGRLIASRVGLPRPVKLERHTPGVPAISSPVLLGAAPGGRLGAQLERLLEDTSTARAAEGQEPVKALVFDATGIADSTELVELQRFFHPNVKRVQASGRVVVLGTPPEGGARTPGHRAAGARGLHPLAGQGDRPGHRRPAHLRRSGRRGAGRVDPALLALPALGLRLRPGPSAWGRP